MLGKENRSWQEPSPFPRMRWERQYRLGHGKEEEERKERDRL